jgi:hypothetical protein
MVYLQREEKERKEEKRRALFLPHTEMKDFPSITL